MPPPTSDDYAGRDTISPRSELLSPSVTDRNRTHRSHHSSSKRRKHRDKHARSTDTAPSDTSQRELLRIVLEQEAEADNLKKALRTTLQRLEEESQKVAEYEKGTKESSEKFKQVNESRLAAEQEATRATQQLHVYEFQLDKAEREIATTQETLKMLAAQKEEAEELAARARARARKLLQKQVVLQAKEEGRRMGFEAGIKQAQEEIAISTTARRALAQTTPEHSTSRRRDRRHRRSESETPSSQSPVEEHRNRDTHPEEHFDDSGPVGNEPSGMTEGDSETLRSPVFNRAPLYPVQGVGRPPQLHDPRHAPSGPPPSRPPPPRPDPSRTPEVQVYSLDIPPAEQIPTQEAQRQQDHDKWVTAQEHREINGSQTSHDTQSRHSRVPSGQGPPPVHPAEVHFAAQPPPPPPQGRWPPPPAPIFPPQPIYQAQKAQAPTPPKSAGSAKKILNRFPSFKDKAQSWYRTFSRRKKNKPVIDPIEEEPEPPQEQVETSVNGAAPNQEGEDLYRFQPEHPTSWYHGGQRRSEDGGARKSQTSLLKPPGHIRASSIDGGGDRVSRASTRLSQLDLLSTAPNRLLDQASMSGRSAHTNNKGMMQKLSSIREGSQRGVSPMADMYAAPTPFTLPPPSEGGRSRKRPPEIAVPPPPGFDPNDPFVQGNFYLVPPNGMPHAVPPSSTVASSTGSGGVGIDVHPATAAIPTSAPPNSALNTGNHLTPNYVWQRPTSTSMRSAPRNPPSNASRKSRQSTTQQAHRPGQSLDVQPQGYQDSRSMRSGHSRSASTGQGYPLVDMTRSMGEPSQPRPSSRTSKAMDPGYRNATSPHAPSLLGGNSPVLRIPSRSSMHSKFDPDNYVDPAYFQADGTAPDSTFLHVQGLSPRPRSRTPSLEYV
ncbi:hypothetical protein DFP72DRAFT_804409 [Ephemerocybe angulata]|uniref:Uncharacterized protein n=1 Tax=Ephemerocybe angulata TaxID=980116 RepID=A0A8H6I933_9AGAR|nr:hypothetical protein DFP72DRAFT_804409 [Tulosesus angulatus]